MNTKAPGSAANTTLITARPALDEKLLKPSQVAEILNVSVGGLANQRLAGRGPAFRKLPNGIIRYPADAVSAWIVGLPYPADAA